ncbi:MAG: HAMP domain-containing histidine kinase [bacterium]|nr:HAMP domain-containing histidine kinase [bacterium]
MQLTETQELDAELSEVENLGGKNVPDLFRQIFLSVPVAMAVSSADGPVFPNPSCADLLRETVGESPQLWQRWVSAALARLVANGSWRDVVCGVCEGRPEVELTLGPEVTRSGHRVITLRRIEASESRSEDLAETVSTLYHELRTPLTSMKSSLSLVQTGETGPLNDEQGHFLGMTMRNIERLDRLVGDLLDASRASAGSLVLKLGEGDLIPVLEEALNQHAETAKTAGLKFETHFENATLQARTDTDKIIQMIANVVGNALKFTPSGGSVTVSVTEDPNGEEFSLVVEDTGPGMDEKALAQVFEPFKRVHDENNCKVLGSGLGLHITRGLIEAQGGKMKLSSIPGKGTCVRLDLKRWLENPENPNTG